MHMLVVRIRHMGMSMTQGFIVVVMAVGPNRHGVVHMVVMTVLMVMGVFVIQGSMQVFMLMRFRQMQKNAAQHQ